MKKKHIGIILVIVAFFWAVGRTVTVKLLSQGGLGLNTILFYQTGFALILMFPFLVYNGINAIVPKKPLYYFLRTLSGILSLYCFFWALERTSLAKAVLLNNSAPLFVPLIIVVFFAAKFKKRNWIFLILGFFGIALILRVRTFSVELGEISALLSGLFAAFSIVSTRVLKKTGNEKSFTIVFYYIFSITIVSGVMLLLHPQFPSSEQWIYLLGGGFMFFLFQILFTMSLAFGKASEISPFMYFGVLFAGIADWVIWKNIPSSMALCGMILVIMGGILSIVFNNE
ncbi:MAG: DMT family transporter [Candidatus Omnitrophica bacterium]|nr:DMT family transporter [Candidatus Omnitrophota bacterium]